MKADDEEQKELIVFFLPATNNQLNIMLYLLFCSDSFQIIYWSSH